LSDGAPDAIATIADAVGFIFVGSLERPGVSTMESVRANESTAVVVVEEVIRTPPGFVLPKGQDVTIQLLAPLARGSYAFFADLLAVGTALALEERAHLDAAEGSARNVIGAAIASGYAARVGSRVRAATLVVLGAVGEIRDAGGESQQDDEHVRWVKASLKVEEVLRGEVGAQEPILVGPSHASRRFPRTPALKAGLRAVFALQPPPPDALEALSPAERGRALFIAETTDVQPPERLDDIRAIALPPTRRRGRK
jgi:hypothetical protein